MTARFTVAHDENGNLRAAQKGMNGAFTDAEIREAVKTARTSDNVLREALKGIQWVKGLKKLEAQADLGQDTEYLFVEG